ncbi:hypothetical protein [Brevibacillus reuszeri]|nr:hypothetical protein [Brevibacillus reuszeri]
MGLVLFSVMLTIMFMVGVAINYQSETAQGLSKHNTHHGGE